jgi:hypothetical protein
MGRCCRRSACTTVRIRSTKRQPRHSTSQAPLRSTRSAWLFVGSTPWWYRNVYKVTSKLSRFCRNMATLRCRQRHPQPRGQRGADQLQLALHAGAAASASETMPFVKQDLHRRQARLP